MLTCTVNQAVGSNLWKLPTNSCYSSQDVITLTQTAGACNGQQPKQCGPFTAQNIASRSGPCLTSSLSVMATMTTSAIKCGIIDINGHETIINTSNINIIGECASYLFFYYYDYICEPLSGFIKKWSSISCRYPRTSFQYYHDNSHKQHHSQHCRMYCDCCVDPAHIRGPSKQL